MSRTRFAAVALATVSAFALSACATSMAETPAPVAVAEPTPAPAPAPARPRPTIGDWGFDLAGMDRSVAAGDDFYAFSNGAWARATSIPADKSNYGMFTALGDLSLTRTRTILDETRGRADSKVGRAYASYLDEAGVEARGLAPIQPWLQIGLAQPQPRRAAIHCAANRRPMALAPGRDTQHMTKAVQAHPQSPLSPLP